MRRLILAALLYGVAPTVGLGQPVEQSASAQAITVELSSFKFTPATLTLQHGQTYRINFTNTSSGGHNFMAKEFFAASTIAPEDQAKVKNGSIDLSGGDTVEITVTPNTPGTYKSHCTHFMHSSFGMTGTIVVT
jgi:plastocyanin